MTYFIELSLPEHPLIDGFQRPTKIAVIGYPTYLSITLNSIKKEIIEIFKGIGLDAIGAILFKKNPNVSSPIHRDLILQDNQWELCNYGVNWNLDNTESIMEWYSTEEKEIWPNIPVANKEFILGGINYGFQGNTAVKNDKFKIVSSLNLTRPTLVRTDIPHRVKNLDVVDRWCLSLRFKQNLNWAEAEQIFSKYKVK